MAPLAALNEISGYLDAIKTAANLKPKRAVAIIDFLELTAASIQRRLTDEYLLPVHELQDSTKVDSLPPLNRTGRSSLKAIGSV